ncbi:MAG: membrane protein insertion efficiency factor YidD [Deltaproteobacteria bacterium]|nr:membrane protein insertion efficiency factor YidD [Deltaproteobacteria bacterium]NIS76087.1 membrane protein insertion efficiency factor YidD [Deltaproteobacteria bacterium]
MTGRAIIGAVRAYRRILSPMLPRCCRYYPTCSEYMIEAVLLNGSIIGLLQGVARILRCSPLFPGGVDFPKNIRRKVWKWSRERY